MRLQPGQHPAPHRGFGVLRGSRKLGERGATDGDIPHGRPLLRQSLAGEGLTPVQCGADLLALILEAYLIHTPLSIEASDSGRQGGDQSASRRGEAAAALPNRTSTEYPSAWIIAP